jgi:hypothetical protein
MSAEIQIWVLCDKTRLYPFQESYSVTGIESSSFDDAMRLPEWVNPAGRGDNAAAGSLFCLLSAVYWLPSYAFTADNKSYKQEGPGKGVLI